MTHKWEGRVGKLLEYVLVLCIYDLVKLVLQ